VPECDPHECDPTAYTPAHDFSQCFTWSDAAPLELLSAHYTQLAQQGAASFLPANLQKVRLSRRPEGHWWTGKHRQLRAPSPGPNRAEESNVKLMLSER
jgi:hypothetical protein